MKLSVEWINQHLDKPLGTRAMADALERAGAEVEEVIEVQKLDKKIVVGLVSKVSQHPNADKLKVAEVDINGKTLSIVCGAPNIAAGQHVPVALVGATLPDGTVITEAKLRGVTSHGMICSEAELGLSSDHSGIMVLPENVTIGGLVSDVISSSDVIDTTTAPNRWDLNSIIGFSQEIAAQTERKSVMKAAEQVSSSNSLKVTISAVKQTPRYVLAGLEVDASQPTPSWMLQRLQASGVRAVNVVVDITNYVMLEFGQPLHAFDAAKVKGGVHVRLARKGEKLVTLDGDVHNLDPADLLIADEAGPIGFAGVMGGQNSEIDAATTKIYLESACFDATTVRKTASRHGLRTDASARFERGIPVDAAPMALDRAVQLLQELAAANVTAYTDKLQVKPVETRIAVRPQRISGLIGIKLDGKDIAAELKKLEFKVDVEDAGLTVTVPWWRPDVSHEADIAEEVIKLVGYDKLPSTLPKWAPQTINFDSRWPDLWRAKTVMRSLGLFEVVTYSFISEEQIRSLNRDSKKFLKLKNPKSIEQEYLRTDLLPSLIKVAQNNRNYSKNFGLFEVSKVYLPNKPGELPNEPTRMAVLARAEKGSYRIVKAALDRLAREFAVPVEVVPTKPIEPTIPYPNRVALVEGEGKGIGWIGQLHPALLKQAKLSGEVSYLEIDWNVFRGLASSAKYRELSRFPSITRDLNLIVSREVTWRDIRAALRDFDAQFISDYYGSELVEGKKAVAVRLTFTDLAKTLTDKEADANLKKAAEIVKKAVGATIRE